jgi:hypothetical protein
MLTPEPRCVAADKDAEREIKTGTQLSRRKPGSTDSDTSTAGKPRTASATASTAAKAATAATASPPGKEAAPRGVSTSAAKNAHAVDDGLPGMPRNAAAAAATAAAAAARNGSPAPQHDMQTPRLVKPAEFMAIVAVIAP